MTLHDQLSRFKRLFACVGVFVCSCVLPLSSKIARLSEEMARQFFVEKTQHCTHLTCESCTTTTTTTVAQKSLRTQPEWRPELYWLNMPRRLLIIVEKWRLYVICVESKTADFLHGHFLIHLSEWKYFKTCLIAFYPRVHTDTHTHTYTHTHRAQKHRQTWRATHRHSDADGQLTERNEKNRPITDVNAVE